MRKIFSHIIVSSLTFIPIHIYAQVELPPIGAEWHYSSYVIAPLDNFFLYQVEKDTTINGKTGRKINRITSNAEVLEYEILYLDSNKVYYWFENDFHLMYDFAAEIGDTVLFSFKSFTLTPPFTDTILEVSGKILEKNDVLINGKLLKRVKSSVIPIAGLENEYIWPGDFIYTEQIGHDYLEMEVIYKILLPSTGSGSRLRCYNNYIDLSYITPFWDNYGNVCDYLLSTNTIKMEQHITVFPNPTKNILNLEIENDLKVTAINLYDIGGNKVKTYIATKRELNIKDITPGNYLLKVSTAKGELNKRIVVE